MFSPSPMPQKGSSPDGRVTTEPQRQALDAMSQELVNKLNVMVAEQEQRAREFAARQHSLSSLPQQTLPSDPVPSSAPSTFSANIYSPESSTGDFRAAEQLRSAPLPGGVAGRNRTAPGRTAPPPQPPVRHPLTGLTRPPDRGGLDRKDNSDFPPIDGSLSPSDREEGKGVNINAGTLIVILLVGLALLRGCGA